MGRVKPRFQLLAQEVNGRYVSESRKFGIPKNTAELIIICLNDEGEVIQEKKWKSGFMLDLHCKMYHIRKRKGEGEQ